MQYGEAFEELGYCLEVPRQDWSAINPGGVCISLWIKEMGKAPSLWMDTRVHADSPECWQHKAGNKKRIAHLQEAVSRFGGRVDVVIVSGNPGESYGTAQPWITKGGRAGSYWEVTWLDEETGDFAVYLRAPGKIGLTSPSQIE